MSQRITEITEITALFTNLAWLLQFPTTIHQNPSLKISSFTQSLNPPNEGPCRVRALDSALSLIKRVHHKVFDLVVECEIETIVAALSGGVGCEVDAVLDVLGKLEEYGEAYSIFIVCCFNGGNVVFLVTRVHFLIQLLLIKNQLTEQMLLSRSFILSLKKSCLTATDSHSGYSFGTLTPLTLKHDVTEILKEYVDRPFLSLKKELHERTTWCSVVICLLTTSEVWDLLAEEKPHPVPRGTSTKARMTHHKSTWALLMDFPQWFLFAAILSPVSGTHSDLLLNYLIKLSNSWKLVECGSDRKSSGSISSKKLRKLRIHGKEKDDIIGKDGYQEVRLWLKEFHDWCELLLHYASTGTILESTRTLNLDWRHAKHNLKGNDEDNFSKSSKDAKAGTLLVLNLFDTIEEITISLFSTEEIGLNFFGQLKTKAVGFLVKCVRKLLQVNINEGKSEILMLTDLYKRLDPVAASRARRF
ncbi:hypothetical protein Scep_024725 [Stephania cephalantha]|uniref:Uncharacterized protein n=1 Tax=Stephania cephalantha TaxID=152367 RepID=A0AAP0HYQ8_9MAGN